eukprot:m.226433 g.226433  ORF g.226433 m.226433 type:complete len:56 (+) comp15169_c0_seq20:1053-1220(+)
MKQNSMLQKHIKDAEQHLEHLCEERLELATTLMQLRARLVNYEAVRSYNQEISLS